MWELIRSWWRWVASPYPMPGQIWDLDGIGHVTVHEVPKYDIRDPGWAGLVICEGPQGKTVAFKMSSFRSYGKRLSPRTLTEAQHL